MSDKIYDLTGKVQEGNVRVFIRPGFGIRLPDPDGEAGEFRHYGHEDNPVDVPVAIASDMLHDGRAFVANEDDEAVDAEGNPVNVEAAAEAVASVDAASPAEAK